MPATDHVPDAASHAASWRVGSPVAPASHVSRVAACAVGAQRRKVGLLPWNVTPSACAVELGGVEVIEHARDLHAGEGAERTLGVALGDRELALDECRGIRARSTRSAT